MLPMERLLSCNDFNPSEMSHEGIIEKNPGDVSGGDLFKGSPSWSLRIFSGYQFVCVDVADEENVSWVIMVRQFGKSYEGEKLQFVACWIEFDGTDLKVNLVRKNSWIKMI